MTFTFTNYRPSTPEQQSPFGNLMTNALQKYMNLNTAQFQKPMLEEALKKSQLFNEYYGPDMESKMGLRGAQTANYGANTEGQNIQNQYLPEKLRSEIQQRQAAAQMSAMKQQIIQQILSGNANQESIPAQELQPTNNAPQVANKPGHMTPHGYEGSLTGKPAEDLYSNTGPDLNALDETIAKIDAANEKREKEKEQKETLKENQKISFPQAALLSQILGLGQPKIVDVNGKQTAITPFGNIEVAKGLNAEEKARQQGFGKYAAKLYGDAIDANRTYENQDLALTELTNAVEKNPDFRNVTGPINKPIATWLGSQSQKELLGSMQTASGEIALQVAPSLKGAFTGRDQTLINEIKASPKDFPDVFIGKLKAQKMISHALAERSKLIAQNIEHGMSPLEAQSKAIKETPLSKYKEQIKELTTHHEYKINKNGKTYIHKNGEWFEK